MNEKINSALAWETGKAVFTDDIRQSMIQAVEQHRKVPRLMLCNSKRALALVAAIACVLVLAGFTAASIFGKLFETIPYHDIVVKFKETAEYHELVGPLTPGHVATKIMYDKGISVLYKYFKGNSFDLECYGENGPDGGFMVIPWFKYDVPEIMLSINITDRTPDFYRQEGQFSFSLKNPSYTLIEVTEMEARLQSLTYEIADGRSITVKTVYGRYQDTGGDLEYRPEYATINGRSFMFLETEDTQGITHELYCYLGDDKLVPAIELSGVPKEELLEAAQHLVLYHEDANIPGTMPKVPDDIYSGNADPYIREHAEEILDAVEKALENSSESTAWSANGRDIYADPSEYAMYDIQITYTPQAWREIEIGYQIPTPPLTPYNWTENRTIGSVMVSYKKGRLETITVQYEDGGGYDSLTVYPLDNYLPQTQLDATLIVFIPAGGQIPDELVELDNNYYMELQLEHGETWIYTAVLKDSSAWGYRYDIANLIE